MFERDNEVKILGKILHLEDAKQPTLKSRMATLPTSTSMYHTDRFYSDQATLLIAFTSAMVQRLTKMK